MSVAETSDGGQDLAAAVLCIGRQAKAAAALLGRATPEQKNLALRRAAGAVRQRQAEILAANALDMTAARAGRLGNAMLDRLLLDAKRIEAIAKGLEEVAALPDPVGRTLAEWRRPNGLSIARVAVPLGVIAIIYESRPNVTADAGGLCLKAGNAAILRGGSESWHSSRAIHACLVDGLKAAALPATAIQLLPTRDRAAVGLLLGLNDYVDIVVPRGGRSLIERVQRESRIPVLAHLDGNCHVYVHAAADLAMAQAVTLNAKLRRTGVCGAAETLLVDRACAGTHLPALVQALLTAGCEVRGDPPTQAIDARVKPASPADWDTEFLDAVIAVKVVDGLDDAIGHIGRHGSHHTDAIVTDDTAAAEHFLATVDSAVVLHNASTQYADGAEFGMGAEIGIATGRLHARGPVGAEQLTSYKYVVRGNGQCRP
ncbi:MAG: glutamate-5-semialdehyde dehydrogenase [Alphaproteobacteria bacterium]|nr:glutamate-5-semialdehyde dehydrogenase [Alphaproteobacteria bacterium]